MDALATALTVPDLWQQQAVNLLRAQHDVIVDAPTGAGKTFIFEHLVERAFPGKAVFTVPTRALANDKFCEWQAKGWRVGIETGDVSYQSDAPIVIATLETQKRALMTGRGPRLLVIDEYQMVGDHARGVNYELALAMAPPDTQLLLLSGSVANPREIEAWLQRCGRTVATVSHRERPVPLDEIHLDALPEQLPKNIHGRWPRYIARALAAGLGPILIFAPRRKAAESLARTLAAALPEPNTIVLTPEQKAIAGNELARALKQRVAFHHSGMSYAQRAALVEPLAKANQLKVIVATTGLAAGINFAMRSVLVLDREYRVAEAHRHLRPDELLQMFGRAGRRGLDDRGSVLFTGNAPRLKEARPLRLQREGNVDWPSLLTVIQTAVDEGKQPLEATRELTARLFAREPIQLGLDDFLHQRRSKTNTTSTSTNEQALSGGTVTEFKNSEGIWERKRAPVIFKLQDTWYLDREHWRPGLSSPKIVASLRIGTICKFGSGKERRYGLEVPLATFPKTSDDNRLTLTKWLVKALREQERSQNKTPNIAKRWTLEKIERQIVPQLASLTRGGRSVHIGERNGTLHAQLDYSEGEIYALKEISGKGLLNPTERQREISGSHPTLHSSSCHGVAKRRRISTSHSAQRLHSSPRTVAEQWYALGLIDEHAHPTRRGIIFSFFNHGEGLAVAAALEADHYPVEELVYDLANLRAGHRFNALALAGRPLTAFCQEAYGLRSIPGYLRRGVPEDYGEGASEILYNIEHKSSRADAYIDDELSQGDIERARIEWRSLRLHIAHAPDYEWNRWSELKAKCIESLGTERPNLPFENLPPLTRQQRSRT
ncbi:DEAD/DEAH box helicase [Coraliomargarita sp. W4R72]